MTVRHGKTAIAFVHQFELHIRFAHLSYQSGLLVCNGTPCFYSGLQVTSALHAEPGILIKNVFDIPHYSSGTSQVAQ